MVACHPGDIPRGTLRTIIAQTELSVDREHGGQKMERLRVIDWEHPANNDFLLVNQFSVTGALYTCRPDLVGFVNPDSRRGWWSSS
jgi:type I site-specific restriction-modification system R (restriction) subunit